MTKTKSPKVLWNDCLDLEAYICSNTDLDIFDLDSINPKTNMSGETSGITTFCKFYGISGSNLETHMRPSLRTRCSL